MKKISLIINSALLLIIIGCSRTIEPIEAELEQNQTNSFNYIAGYMFYEGNYDSSSKISVDLINSKPIKRTLPANTAGVIGGTSNINDGLYEDIKYIGNTITIVQKSSNPNSIINNGKRIITIENAKIFKKEDFDQNNAKYYETQFLYAGNRIISYSNYKPFPLGGMYLFSKSEVYYNTQNNVDSIVTKRSEYDYNLNIFVFNNNTLKRSVETFSNFDQVANPIKNLGIFDELFYRSLSTNNFKNYQLKTYDENGLANGATAQKSWTFVYENGQINFDK